MYLREMELNRNSNMVLLRQPIGKKEVRMGGVIGLHPEKYEDKSDGENCWVEHRRIFSCNPCLYNKSLIYKHPWPDVLNSERRYGYNLFKDHTARSAYWGRSNDPPIVEHIGVDRTGFNY